MPVFDKVSQNFMNFSTNQNLKKSLEEKNQEKTKIYSYIGMESYDLHKAGKLEVQELEIHFEKLETLEKEIAELNDKLSHIAAGTGKIVCSCGNTISAQMKFCPQCGKPVEINTIICSCCGKQIKNDMQFCPNCGNRVKTEPVEQTQTVQEEPKFRECICGAKILDGQTICMECGRKVEI